MPRKRRRRRQDVQVGDYRPDSDGEDSREEMPPAVRRAREQVTQEEPAIRLVPRDEVAVRQVVSPPGLAPKAACIPLYPEGMEPKACFPTTAKGSVALELSGVAAPLPKAKGVITKEKLEKEKAARAARKSEAGGKDKEGSGSQGSFDSLSAPAVVDNQDRTTPEVRCIYLGWFLWPRFPLSLFVVCVHLRLLRCGSLR